MSYTVPYQLVNIERIIENFNVDDLGNFSVEKTSTRGVKTFLFVSTKEALTSYVKITGPFKKLGIEMGIIEFKHHKVVKIIKTFLGGDVDTLRIISSEEFFKEFEKISEIYLKRVDIERCFVI